MTYHYGSAKVDKALSLLSKMTARLKYKTGQSLKDCGISTVKTLLVESEMLNLHCRCAFLDLSIDNRRCPDAQPEDLGKYYNLVHAKYLDNGVVEIISPPVIDTTYKPAFYLSHMVRDELKRLETEEGPFTAKQKFWIMYLRYGSACHRKICDNDNLETRQITNAITEAFAVHDRADVVSVLYQFIQNEEPFTRILIVPDNVFYSPADCFPR